jgi:hypothetical protein
LGKDGYANATLRLRRNKHGKLLAVVVAHGGNKLNGAAAITYDGGTKIQRHYGGYPADDGGCAL